MRSFYSFSRTVLLVALCAFVLPESVRAQSVDIRVCVLDEDGVLRQVVATYDTESADTTVSGLPFSIRYPQSKAPYAARQPWYINNERIEFSGGLYEKYGLPRVLGVDDVERGGWYRDVPVFFEAGVSGTPEVVYIPVRHGCEVQPYMRSGEARAQTPQPRRVQEIVRVVRGDDLSTRGTAHSVVRVEEVRFTPAFTDVLIRFNTLLDDYTGIFHPPGADFAMHLEDEDGRVYEQTGQIGWPGPDNGYGRYTIPQGGEVFVIVHFEDVLDYDDIEELRLIEGTCTSGCWNFHLELADR